MNIIVDALSGASDNLVSCAVMLEVLISLSGSDQPLPNEVIFLFNGAEENFHQVDIYFLFSFVLAVS